MNIMQQLVLISFLAAVVFGLVSQIMSYWFGAPEWATISFSWSISVIIFFGMTLSCLMLLMLKEIEKKRSIE